MNVVANSFALGSQDEVLLTDHEYGAVLRIWQRACRAAGAAEPIIASLPTKVESADQVVDAIFAAATDRTRLLIVSHITSPTAVILPVQKICDEARRRGIAVVIDGPHAPAQAPLAIDALGCDFYTASLHKWVSAPIGSGFLYVVPHATGCRNNAAAELGTAVTREAERVVGRVRLAGHARSVGIPCIDGRHRSTRTRWTFQFSARTHALAKHTRERIVELTGLEPPTPNSDEWYGSMASVPLPPGDAPALQKSLWQKYGIEIPVVDRNGNRSVRVSCHLYTGVDDIDALLQALKALLRARDLIRPVSPRPCRGFFRRAKSRRVELVRLIPGRARGYQRVPIVHFSVRQRHSSHKHQRTEIRRQQMAERRIADRKVNADRRSKTGNASHSERLPQAARWRAAVNAEEHREAAAAHAAAEAGAIVRDEWY